MIKLLNGLIGFKWLVVGIAMFLGSIVSFSAYFILDLQKLFSFLPIPDRWSNDFIHLFSLLIIGLFCMVFGGRMIRKWEWAAFAAGLVYIMIIIYMIAIAYLFEEDPAQWLLTTSAREMYHNWFWLLWFTYGAMIFGAGVIVYLFLFSQGRFNYYAETYVGLPAWPITCQNCGLIIEQAGDCPTCDYTEKKATLTIGDSQRQMGLLFTRSRNRFLIGRSKANTHVDITINEGDSQSPNSVSSEHAALIYDFEERSFLIEDRNSANGTYLNGEKLVEHKSYPLTNGQKISLAKVVELFLES